MPELKQHPEALAGVPAEEIITVVSGLPRSGTSLMMQILEAAGVPPFTDNKRQADESNRKGYYEHDKVASLLSDSGQVLDQGSERQPPSKSSSPSLPVCHVNSGNRTRTPEPLHYRILFMERDMEEILQSQDTMLRRLGKSPAAGEKPADISKAYRQQERHAKSWCATLGIHAMSVNLPCTRALPR